MNAGGKITYTNRTRHRLRIILEPWAEEYWIEPNDPIDIVARNGNSRGHLEIEQIDAGLIIYGWEGLVVSIIRNGKGLAPSSER
jgi:hypothetical protein